MLCSYARAGSQLSSPMIVGVLAGSMSTHSPWQEMSTSASLHSCGHVTPRSHILWQVKDLCAGPGQTFFSGMSPFRYTLSTAHTPVLCSSISVLPRPLGTGDMSQSVFGCPSSVSSSKKAQGPESCGRERGPVPSKICPAISQACMCSCKGLSGPVSLGVSMKQLRKQKHSYKTPQPPPI